MIAGNALATGTQPFIKWGCQGESIGSGNIVQCSSGNPNLEFLIDFPECWDGINLDSADHKSHMAYARGGSCPATHPVPLPVLEYKFVYDTIGGPGFRLSSGEGYTLHADAWMMWIDSEAEMRLINCIRVGKKCPENGLSQDGNSVINQPPNIPTTCSDQLPVSSIVQTSISTQQTSISTQPTSISSSYMASTIQTQPPINDQCDQDVSIINSGLEQVNQLNGQIFDLINSLIRFINDTLTV